MTSLPSDERQRCGSELLDHEYRYCDWCQPDDEDEE